MLICTLIDVDIPRDMPPDERAALIEKEAAISKEMQEAGKLAHIWRVAGRWANVSVWNVKDNDDFHQTIGSFPMFSYLKVTVIPLSQHPNSIR